MTNLRQILNEIEELINLKNLTGAYEEIASMKMRRIRGNVLASREYIDALAEIYRELLITYRGQIMNILKDTKGSRLSLRKTNGKTACVFFSANSGLFGAILHRAYEDFKKYVQEHEVEAVIVGNYGKNLFQRDFPDRKFVFFPLENDVGSPEIFKKITGNLIQYDNAIIFYARFNTMSSQNIAMLDVAGAETPLLQAEVVKANYHFEPSLEKILEFFEQEIFANIVEQNFTESELARYASRIVSLDNATKNINNRLKTTELEHKVAIHRTLNKKQTEAMAGLALWKLT